MNGEMHSDKLNARKIRINKAVLLLLLHVPLGLAVVVANSTQRTICTQDDEDDDHLVSGTIHELKYKLMMAPEKRGIHYFQVDNLLLKCNS